MSRAFSITSTAFWCSATDKESLTETASLRCTLRHSFSSPSESECTDDASVGAVPLFEELVDPSDIMLFYVVF
eukprot:4770531-Prymnesium_polylepis.1